MALRPKNNFISLCTGGGGLDLGVELAIPDARPVVLVEREAFAVGHLVSKMEKGILAPTPVWSDVRTFNGRPWRGLVDGVIGGIPCQPHSVAGRRLGQADERDLWSDARRIIVQSGAWWCLIENVAGMCTTGGFERIYRDLQRLGFRVEAGLFTSAEVGASHKRERLFVIGLADRDSNGEHQSQGLFGNEWGRSGDRRCNVGNTNGTGLEGRGRGELCERPGERAAWPPSSPVEHTESLGRREWRAKPEFRSGWDSAASDGGTIRGTVGRTAPERTIGTDLPLYPPGPSDLDAWRTVIERAPGLKPAICRVANDLANRLDRLRMLGNGVNPLQAAYAIRALGARLAEKSAGSSQSVL